MSYEDLKVEIDKIANLNSAISLLHWDMEVNMPPKGADQRSKQLGVLSAMSHELFTGDRFGDILTNLKHEDLEPDEAKNVQLIEKERRKMLKLPSSFVQRQQESIGKAYQAWTKARKEKDFAVFKPFLKTIFDLAKEKANLLGYEGHAYNALLDEYEPNCTVDFLDPLFEDLKAKLKPLLQKIKNAEQVSDAVFLQHFDKDKQWQYSLDVLKDIGYDFDAGRQDLAAHPFSISFHPSDVRVTTRYDEQNLAYIVWSTIHEGGHALYEQGLPSTQFGLPLGTAMSLGIHESQSRLYENNVGRSLAFCKNQLPKLKQYFSQIEVDAMGLFKACNKIYPSFIRTESDELHYHFHVIIRYEVEKALLEGSIDIDEVEKYWNQKYFDYLGIKVESPLDGILQDIHWAHGSIGYFPTYSLGSLYAAQFFQKIKEEIPALEQQIEDGNFKPLLEWLRTNVHQEGMRYVPQELCEKITGKPLDVSYFMNYATQKYKLIYDL